MKIRSSMAAVVAAGALSGCATPSSPPASLASAPGESKATAIEVCRPAGERAYLDRLRCPDASTPIYRRVGSFGGRTDFPKNLPKDQEAALLEHVIRGEPLEPGEPDYHVVDGFEVACGAVKRTVYLDMYHCPSSS